MEITTLNCKRYNLSIKHPHQNPAIQGFTVLEMLVALSIMTVVLLIFTVLMSGMMQSSYRADDVATTQTQLRLVAQQITKDLNNAGAGLDVNHIFDEVSTTRLVFNFEDLLKENCHKADSTIVTVDFKVDNDTLYRYQYCDHSLSEKSALFKTSEDLNLSFKYFNKLGDTTTEKAVIRAVQYSVNFKSEAHSTNMALERALTGKVFLFNVQ